MAFLGGLLGAIGRGISGALDTGAYDTAGGSLLGSLLADPSQQALPPQGLMPSQAPITGKDELGLSIPGGVTPMGGLRARPLPPMQQTIPGQQWQPDADTKRMMRGNFFQALMNGINLAGTGRGNMGDAMRDYRNNTLDMLLLAHQARAAQQQQSLRQQAAAGLSADMQQAGGDEDMQRQALQKWGPYVGPELLKSYGDIAKDYRKPINKLSQILKIRNPNDPTTEMNIPLYEDGTQGQPILSGVAEKFQNLDATHDVVGLDGIGQPLLYQRPDGSTVMGMKDYKNRQILDPDTGKPIPGKLMLSPAEKAATALTATDYAAISQGIDPKTGGAYVAKPGGLTPEIAGKIYETIKPPKPVNTFNLGQARLNDKERTQMIKYYEPASDAATTFNTMTKNWNDAFGDPKHPNQQAMLSLLSQHIGMTTGKGGAGMRPTQAMFREAQQSVPLLKGIQARFGPDGLMSGVTLTPEQGAQMVQLGRDRYIQKLQQSRANANAFDINRTIDPGGKGPLRTPEKSTVAYYHNLALMDPSVQREGDPKRREAAAMALTQKMMDDEGWSTQ